MRILVTGSAGYIGSVLCQVLLEEGHEVEEFDIVNGKDVRETQVLIRAMKEQDAVIWLASISNNDECVKSPAASFWTNVNSVSDAIAICRQRTFFIYASSVAAYSSIEDASEGFALAPTTPYAKGKMICEEMLQLSGIPHTIVRSASVCGPSPKMRYDITVNQMVHDAKTKGVITVNGGEQKRCHVHIRDLCDFYRLLLKAPGETINGEAFNVVAENSTVLDTANVVIKALASESRRARNMPFIAVGPATDDRSYTVDGSKARRILGFIPTRTVADAVREMNGQDRTH